MSGTNVTVSPTLDDPAIWIHFGDTALSAGRYAEAETWYLRALDALPEDSDLLNNMGTAVWYLGRVEAAEDFYRRAIRFQPGSHSFRNNLGNIHRAMGRLHEAESCYRQALELEPRATESRINLGVVLSDLGHLEESENLLRESLTIRPDIPDAHLNLGTTLMRLGRPDESIACYEEAIRLRPNYAEAHRNRAMYWLSVGDYERGWPEYEWRWRCHARGLPVGDRPLWTGEKLQGRSILLHAEQGLGDTLQFVRYAESVKQRGAEVTLACSQPLVRLLGRCPGIDRVIAIGSQLPATDFQSPLMSLPAIFGTTLATVPAQIPYFRLEANLIEHWRKLLEPVSGLKVGIAWQGNPRFPGDSRRSFPLTEFFTLAELPDVRLISLQFGPGSEQIDKLNGRFVVEDVFGHTGRSERDFLDTAALVKNLDLVISADSAIAHLAGSLGISVWVALQYASEWRWLRERDDSPWYPTMRLFRQSSPGVWGEVFGRMATALVEYGRLRRESPFT